MQKRRLFASTSFQGLLTGLMMVGGCRPGAVLWVGSNTAPFIERQPRNVQASAPVIPTCRRDTVDPHQKTVMVQSFVAAFVKAARVSNVPEEAIMSDTREPSYMFLAAEWNRSSVSERAYLLAMLFGREFEVEASDLSLQNPAATMTMLVKHW